MGASLLSVKNLAMAAPDGRVVLRDVSFQLRAGEVLGLGGLMGSGRTELLLHLFGAWGRRISGIASFAADFREQVAVQLAARSLEERVADAMALTWRLHLT